MRVNESDSLPGRNEFAGSFAKGIDVLRALGRTDQTMTLSDLSYATGQSRASARRFALTLVHLQMAEQSDAGFRLTHGALRVDDAGAEFTALRQAAAIHAKALIERFREASSFGRRDGDEVEIMCYTKADRLMTMRLDVGDRLPLLRSAQGRVLAAALPEPEVEALLSSQEDADFLRQHLIRTRDVGYALLDEEMEEGVRSIALPVVGPRSGRVVAAMSLCAHAQRVPLDVLLSDGLAALRVAANRTTEDAAKTLK
ncbi:IclR family transcriptional regulator domain-containing protein [Paracoccus jeotgali]|uniref:IclR family transcriptional regulator domain-containing protein n=1 Tax=Paracoccus jeotgali TaxID=2065379 RepID=UPI0028A6E6B8|nr:IclR family transcriptional regulator C-terminal domain-containing protein [Paracoccus jeotgali]